MDKSLRTFTLFIILQLFTNADEKSLASYWMTSWQSPNQQRLLLYSDQTFTYHTHSDLPPFTKTKHGAYKMSRGEIHLTYEDQKSEVLKIRTFGSYNKAIIPKLHSRHPLFRVALKSDSDWRFYQQNDKTFEKLQNSYYTKLPHR